MLLDLGVENEWCRIMAIGARPGGTEGKRLDVLYQNDGDEWAMTGVIGRGGQCRAV